MRATAELPAVKPVGLRCGMPTPAIQASLEAKWYGRRAEFYDEAPGPRRFRPAWKRSGMVAEPNSMSGALHELVRRCAHRLSNLAVLASTLDGGEQIIDQLNDGIGVPTSTKIESLKPIVARVSVRDPKGVPLPAHL